MGEDRGETVRKEERDSDERGKRESRKTDERMGEDRGETVAKERRDSGEGGKSEGRKTVRDGRGLPQRIGRETGHNTRQKREETVV